MALGSLLGGYLAIGVVHGLLVTGLAARARARWPVWTTETGMGWAVNLLAWPLVAAEAFVWGVQATWAAYRQRSRGA
jgi:hypothetical protein